MLGLVVNLKTAKTLGLDVPALLSAVADELIDIVVLKLGLAVGDRVEDCAEWAVPFTGGTRAWAGTVTQHAPSNIRVHIHGHMHPHQCSVGSSGAQRSGSLCRPSGQASIRNRAACRPA
jgi:hypothetical protein